MGLAPTRATVTRPSSTSAPATRRKAAEEISPGTATAWPRSSRPGVIVTVRPSTESRAPKPASIRSVWSRDWAGSVTLTGPSAQRPARRRAVLIWAEATGDA